MSQEPESPPRAPSNDVIATRLAVLLRARRDELDVSVRQLARRSRGRFSPRQLRGLEHGTVDIATVDLPALAALYAVELAAMHSARMPLTIDTERGVISTAGVTTRFDPDDETTLYVTYLRMMRELRGLTTESTIRIRRSEIVVLAEALVVDHRTVVERLADLMGSTGMQRRVALHGFAAGDTTIVIPNGPSDLGADPPRLDIAQ